MSEERCKSAVPDVIKRKLTIKAFHTLADALWTIEVADSSVGYDRLIKVPLYAKNRIAEF